MWTCWTAPLWSKPIDQFVSVAAGYEISKPGFRLCSSDEAKYARTYVLEAQRGHYLVVVHAVQPEVAHGDQLELFIVRKAGIYDARGERGHVQTRTGGPRCWVR